MSELKVIGWSPSRLAKWRECPAKVKYEDLLKLCPACFNGSVSGGFDGEPVKCTSCDKPQPEREALDRGNMLDGALTRALDPKVKIAKVAYVAHMPESAQPLQAALRHPAIEKLFKFLRRSKGVSRQESIVLQQGWKRVGQFTRGAWGRMKLDVLRLTPKIAHVIDWKSGNIDKKTNQIRERAEYADSMRLYQIGVLASHPQAEVTATMAFIDAPLKLDNPFKTLPVLRRVDLAKAQEEMEKKLAPMFADRVFAPRPGMYCRWCSFAKGNGGPCQF